jgi:predicted aspartyl protease
MERTIGKVLVTAKIENLADLFDVQQGRLSSEQVRTVEAADALVATGATTLSLPKRLIDPLGLKFIGERRARTSGGSVLLRMFGTVQLTVQGRFWRGDVLEIPDDCPPLIGQIPLESLDFVVDPQGQCLIGNPAHGGEQMVELY